MNYISEAAWLNALGDEFRKDYFKALISGIENDKKAGKLVLPFPSVNTYRALELCPLDRVKVVILGQDPYPRMKDATGLAFSVSNTSDIPKSLANIFKELKSDLGIDNLSKGYGDLSFWATQGVLLLNTVLTTIEGEPNAHKGYGWEIFTDKVLLSICKQKVSMVYLLMGKDAQAKKQFIKDNSKSKVTIIETAHPSPLSAHRGFFWSKPFSQINEALASYKLQPIDWRL